MTRRTPSTEPASASNWRALLDDLCAHACGVTAPGNAGLFAAMDRELPLTLHRYASGQTHNGWVVPDEWWVEKALIYRDGRVLHDCAAHTLGVAAMSRSFVGELDWEDLRPRLVSNPDLPSAYVYHCMWQYRPWAADWALSVPHEVMRHWGPGRYRVELVTHRRPGHMLVGEHLHAGELPQCFVFAAHTCHPHMANDDLAGAAVLIRLFQWLAGRRTRYSYRLLLGPEHLGTVFYLRDCSRQELELTLGGVFAEMPGTSAPLKAASTFLGGQAIDLAVANAVQHHGGPLVTVPWRQGAGNDETVWEAPGYEVPFVELSRCEDTFAPFREYHTSLDTPELMDEGQMERFLEVLKQTVFILENDCTLHRRFQGLVCLSHPDYDLYQERPDPAVQKDLAADSEKWGYLLDCLLRYMDGSVTLLEMAQRHGLAFDRLQAYLSRFAAKGLVEMRPRVVSRAPISRPDSLPVGA